MQYCRKIKYRLQPPNTLLKSPNFQGHRLKFTYFRCSMCKVLLEAFHKCSFLLPVIAYDVAILCKFCGGGKRIGKLSQG